DALDHLVDGGVRIQAEVGECAGLGAGGQPACLALLIVTGVRVIGLGIERGSHLRILLGVGGGYDCDAWRPETIGPATMDAQSENLVLEAEAAYNGVVRAPARYADEIPILIARARAAGNTEALVIALRAQAWARHAVLDNAAAKLWLDQAARLAHREGLSQRLGDVLVTRAIALHELGRRAEARRDLARAE